MTLTKSLALGLLLSPAFSFANTICTVSNDTTQPQIVAKTVATTQVRESEKLMSLGNKNSLTIEITQAKAKFVEKMWKDYAKQFKGKTDRDKKTEEVFTDNAVSAALGGANTVDMFAKFAEVGENVQMTLWIDLGGAYINSKDFPEKYNEAEKILLSFNLEVQREQTRMMLEDQKDELKKMEKKQKGLEKDNTDLHSDIENYKAKIKKAESDIETNVKNQEDTKQKIANQKKLLEEIQKKLDSLK